MSLITLNHLNWQCTMRSVQLNKNIQSYSLAGRWCASMWGEGLTSTSDTTNHRIDPNTLRPSRTCWRYHRSLRREIVDRRQWLVQSTRLAHSYHTSLGRSSADILLHVHIISRSYCYTVWSAIGISLLSVRPSVCLSVTLCIVALRVGVRG